MLVPAPRRILLCPADAYFDILSLANGTDMAALGEASWLNLSFLLHPKLCPLSDAVKALCRVNDAYAWIQRHPRLAQPHVSLAPMPHVAQATLPPPRASSAASSPRVDSAREPQQPWDSLSTQWQPHFSTQQPESDTSRSLKPPLRRKFPPSPSSHVYVSHGKPIRTLVEWQFRKTRGRDAAVVQGPMAAPDTEPPDFSGFAC